MAEVSPSARHKIRSELERIVTYPVVAMFTKYEHHSDHDTLFTVRQTLEYLETTFRAQNLNRLPYKNISLNPAPPLKRALSPPNLLIVFALYYKLASLKTFNINTIEAGVHYRYHLRQIDRIDAPQRYVVIKLDKYNVDDNNAHATTKQLQITFGQNPYLCYTNGRPFDAKMLNIYPELNQTKGCRFSVSHVAIV